MFVHFQCIGALTFAQFHTELGLTFVFDPFTGNVVVCHIWSSIDSEPVELNLCIELLI